MLIASYNNKAFDDLLIVQLKKSSVENQIYEKKNQITRLKDKETGESVGFNFFQVSNWIEIEENGPVDLSEADVNQLNQALKDAGFEDELVADPSPKFVVGYVKECEAMEDSDHLFITQTEIEDGETLQIVCGADNIAQGQKVVVAKPGATMPDGTVIWPGELRGTKSMGMISSASELNIDVPTEKEKGILVLDEDLETGSPFKF
ncbi:MAG: DUF4479 and tRNA-binding domain-containing protein [Atopostipes sp.]|nr:DUF4479 and tRNA-binding domain-containing protein [Atopostipes sp.]